ncbi:hypothetical protein DFH09DRAFT_1276316 [Mycena vulgaris]|nr:hypothetical protein DFH09DRAFT_1276316 [Mycena vulgaris]
MSLWLSWFTASSKKTSNPEVFKTYADKNMPIDPNRPWAQQDMIRPQAEVHTKLQIGCFGDQQFRLDHSFAVLGFQAHRPASIFRATNPPTQINKHIQAANVQHTITATVGLSGTVPAPTASAAYANGHSTTHSVEAVDNKVIPAHVYLNDIVSAGDQPPVDVGFALGINFFGRNAELIVNITQNEIVPPPQVSCVNQNQIFLWVPDPNLRSMMRGIMLALNGNFPDIRRRSEILRADNLKINLETGQTTESKTMLGKDETDSAISLSCVALGKFKRTFRRIKPPAPQVSLAIQESVNRGWDVTNYQWRNAIYPELDKHFQPVLHSQDQTLVAYKIAKH